MKILITGGTGLIGSRLINKLIESHNLAIISRKNISLQNIEIVQSDITNYNRIQEFVHHFRPNVIIHLAALKGTDCDKDPFITNKINIEAVTKLAEIAVKYEARFIFLSTASIYSNKINIPAKETDELHPLNLYAESKAEAEKELLKNTSLKYLILRVFNIYGPGFEDSLVNKLVASNSENPIRIINPNRFFRDYIHVDELINIICEMIERTNQTYKIYNIATGKSISTKKLIEILINKGIHPHYQIIETNKPDYSIADISRIKEDKFTLPKSEIRIEGIQ